MARKAATIPRYRVMAECGSAGVWQIAIKPGGRFRHGMVEHARSGCQSGSRRASSFGSIALLDVLGLQPRGQRVRDAVRVDRAVPAADAVHAQAMS